MIKTATAVSTPALVDQSVGNHQGNKGGGKTREERENYEWYDNFDDTYTMKKVVWIKTTEINEEHIYTHRTIIETISKEEYFKKKLTGTLYRGCNET